MNIVIDKSYLKAASTNSISQISKNHGLIVSESLMYECMKNSSGDRAKLFRKFPNNPKPFLYAPTIGELMRYEIRYRSSCGIPSTHAKERNYSFLEELKRDEYELSPEHKIAMSIKLDELKIDEKNFLELLWFESEKDEKRISCQEREFLEKRIASDADYINGRIDQCSNTPNSLIPKSINYDEHWVTFRWFQVLELFKLDLRCRYQNIDTIKKSEKALDKLRHDILDAQYLILATLEGGFATKEKKLIRWWQLLQPKGCLYQ